jgi:WD40 repeat protein
LVARSASIQVWEDGDAPLRTMTLPSNGAGPRTDGAGGLVVQPREVRAVCITADGRLALSAAQGDAVRVWNVETGTMIGTLGEADVHSGGVSSDGAIAVSASWRAAIDVWDPARGGHLSTLSADGVVGALVLAADGRTAVSACAKQITAWDLPAGVARSFELASAPVRTLALTPDGRFCAAGLEGGGAALFHVEAGRRISSLSPRPGHPERSAPNVAIAADARAVVVAGADGALEVWSGVDDRRVLEPPGGAAVRGRPLPVAMTDAATQVLGGAEDGSLVAWTLDWTYEFEAPKP